jgi:hypothetical protein
MTLSTSHSSIVIKSEYTLGSQYRSGRLVHQSSLAKFSSTNLPRYHAVIQRTNFICYNASRIIITSKLQCNNCHQRISQFQIPLYVYQKVFFLNELKPYHQVEAKKQTRLSCVKTDNYSVKLPLTMYFNLHRFEK